jgi:hypothetical protein
MTVLTLGRASGSALETAAGRFPAGYVNAAGELGFYHRAGGRFRQGKLPLARQPPEKPKKPETIHAKLAIQRLAIHRRVIS